MSRRRQNYHRSKRVAPTIGAAGDSFFAVMAETCVTAANLTIEDGYITDGESVSCTLDTTARGSPKVIIRRDPRGTSSELRVRFHTQLPRDAQPVIQYRGICAYRTIETMTQALESITESSGSERIWHALALFEVIFRHRLVKLATVEHLERPWAKYTKLRSLGLSPGTQGEASAALTAALRLARQLLTTTNGGPHER